MMKKLLLKIKAFKKHNQAELQPSGHSLRLKCQNITSQLPIFQDSIYFTTHLPLILQPESIQAFLDSKVGKILKGIHENSTYEIQLASIILNMTQEDGLFYIFIKLWASFCQFELKKIVEDHDKNHTNSSKKGENNIEKSNTQIHSENKFEQNKRLGEKNVKISSFFQREFFLLCFFIYELSLYLYKNSFSSCEQFSTHQLFLVIRNNITTIREWSNVHDIFRRHVKCEHQDFTQAQIGENMAELQKICKVSKIPAPFRESINIMNQFNKTPSIQDKLRNCVQLIDKLKEEMLEYRIVNGMGKGHIFCADDVLSALTFAMWRLRKDLHGACVYVEVILCCQYQNIDEDRLANELNNFGCNVRHSFDTLKSVARIGLLDQDKIYSII